MKVNIGMKKLVNFCVFCLVLTSQGSLFNNLLIIYLCALSNIRIISIQNVNKSNIFTSKQYTKYITKFL